MKYILAKIIFSGEFIPCPARKYFRLTMFLLHRASVYLRFTLTEGGGMRIVLRLVRK